MLTSEPPPATLSERLENWGEQCALAAIRELRAACPTPAAAWATAGLRILELREALHHADLEQYRPTTADLLDRIGDACRETITTTIPVDRTHRFASDILDLIAENRETA